MLQRAVDPLLEQVADLDDLGLLSGEGAELVEAVADGVRHVSVVL